MYICIIPSYNMDGMFYNIYQETLMFYVEQHISHCEHFFLIFILFLLTFSLATHNDQFIDLRLK